MLSRGTATAALALGLVLACVGTARAEQDHATPQEVMQRVQQAAQDLAKSGEAGLATFSSKNATSVWKDSYIFVLSCKGGTAVNVAHPIRPELKGKPTAQIVTFGPKSGEQIAADFCAAGRAAARRVGGIQLPQAGEDGGDAQGELPPGGPGHALRGRRRDLRREGEGRGSGSARRRPAVAARTGSTGPGSTGSGPGRGAQGAGSRHQSPHLTFARTLERLFERAARQPAAADPTKPTVGKVYKLP